MILNFGLYKNRELKWNVKDKDTASRELDAGCAVYDAVYRAEEFKLMLRRKSPAEPFLRIDFRRSQTSGSTLLHYHSKIFYSNFKRL